MTATPVSNGRYTHHPYTPVGQTASYANGQIITPSPAPHQPTHNTPQAYNSKGLGTPKLAGLTDTDIRSELIGFSGGGGGPIYEPQRFDSPMDGQRQSSSPWRGTILTPQGTPKHNHSLSYAQHNARAQHGRSQVPKPMLFLGGESPAATYHPVPRPTNSARQSSFSYETQYTNHSTSSFHKPPVMMHPHTLNPYPKVRSHPEFDSTTNLGPIRVTPVNNGKSAHHRGENHNHSPRVSPIHSCPSPTKKTREYAPARLSGGSIASRGPPAPLGENPGNSMEAVWTNQKDQRTSLPREGSSDGIALIGTPTAEFSATYVTTNSPMEPENSSVASNDKQQLATRVFQRQKQINIGKATIGYVNYVTAVPIQDREEGNPLHPTTPTCDGLCPKRGFDRFVRGWRKALHNWDLTPGQSNTDELDCETGSLHVGHGSDAEE